MPRTKPGSILRDRNAKARVFDDHDLVFGVWDDPALPEGVGCRLIKGRDLLTPLTPVQGDDGLLRVAVVSFVDEEHALAIEKTLGAKKLH